MDAPTVVTLRQGEAIANDVRLYAVPDVIILVDDTSPNTITFSAPVQTELHAITLDAGTNTITLSAPTQTELHAITLAAGANTVTLTASSQSQLVELTLAAGSNTITLSAPTVPAVNLTMPLDTNTITLTAPAQSQSVAITLAAGSNTITLSAPAQSQSMAITLSASSNTITLSAPAQSQVVAITLDAGSNTITLSAPAQSESHAVTLAAGANTITLSAPTVPAVDLTMPVSTCTVTLTAPAQSEVHAITLAAGSNVITLSAPDVPAVHLTMPVSTNTVTLSAPTQSQVVEVTLVATVNTITLSAPAPIFGFDQTLVATTNLITLSAPAPNFAFDQFLQAGNNTETDITAPDATLLVGVQFYENWVHWSEELDQIYYDGDPLDPSKTWYASHIVAVPDVAIAPDGTMTADKVRENTDDSSHEIIATVISDIAEVGQTVCSIYAHAAEHDVIYLELYDSHPRTPYCLGNYSLTGGGSAGVIEGGAAATVGIEDVGGGWYRCWISFYARLAQEIYPGIYIGVDGYNGVAGDGVSGVYLWGFQVEEGSAPSAYIKTTTEPVPHTVFTFDAPVITLTAPIAELVQQGSLLAGPNTVTITAPIATVPVTLAAVTNLLTASAPDATLLVGVQFYENWLLQSENMDAVYPPWTPIQSSVVPNAALAPDGTMTADKLVDVNFPVGFESTHAVTGNLLSTMTDVTVSVFSVYLKAAEYDSSTLIFYDDAPTTGFASADYVLTGSGSATINGYVGFDGVDGVKQAAGIENVGNGWYRCWLSIGMLLASSCHFEIDIKDAGHIGDPTKGIYAWGAQVNRDSISPSPYLKSGSEVLSSTVFTFAPPALIVTAPVAQFFDPSQILVGTANQITLTAPIAILTRRVSAAKRATARITLSKACSTVVAVQEPLTAKLGLVVSSSGVVVG